MSEMLQNCFVNRPALYEFCLWWARVFGGFSVVINIRISLRLSSYSDRSTACFELASFHVEMVASCCVQRVSSTSTGAANIACILWM